MILEKLKNEKERLSRTERKIAELLLADPDAFVRMSAIELSRRAGLKPPTVSVALKHLEDEGYVVRVTDEDDKRAARVYLSDKGHALEKENAELRKANAELYAYANSLSAAAAPLI